MKVAKKTAITLYHILSYTKHYEIYGADNILAIMTFFLWTTLILLQFQSI